MKTRLGYACLDLTLTDTFKTCRLKTFKEKGISYINELCLHNVSVLDSIIDNNIKNKIDMYRMTSGLMPWYHLYNVNDLPDYDKIVSMYKVVGEKIITNDIRVSFHPDHFTVLGSENPKVVEQSIKDVNHHSFLMDLLGVPDTHFCKINVHISNTKPSKVEAIKRFIYSFNKLDENAKKRLTIENDDNINGYSVEELYDVYTEIGTPIVFDSLHYECNKGNKTYEEALGIAVSTWSNVNPVVHHSSSRVKEDITAKKTAHSDYIFENFNCCSYNVDIMLEAKAKNLALFKYKEDYSK